MTAREPVIALGTEQGYFVGCGNGKRIVPVLPAIPDKTIESPKRLPVGRKRGSARHRTFPRGLDFQ